MQAMACRRWLVRARFLLEKTGLFAAMRCAAPLNPSSHFK
ncbi:hypothetical protein BIFDEN_00465 [Bifidobacterium dentium ATCC 27678]|nr:hypothetical protein BIFDEN_00465 [Bifidobacterium dentium ATCC 27678]